MTEDEVLEVYWDYWKDKMEKAEKPSHLITESNCIEDFITVHWGVDCDDTEIGETESGVLRLRYGHWIEYCKMRGRYEKGHS